MFKPLATRLLQHLLSQNTWAFAALLPFAGKSVQFIIGPVTTRLVILENGNLCLGADSINSAGAINDENSHHQPQTADASVTIAPSVALRLMAGDNTAKMLINITGDTHLASELSRVLQNISWDYEEDLSQLTGDIAANKLGQWGRQTVSGIKEKSINIAEMMSEYWQEEQPLIAKKRHVDKFTNAVDTLRADVERAEKRLEKISAKIIQKYTLGHPSNGTKPFKS